MIFDMLVFSWIVRIWFFSVKIYDVSIGNIQTIIERPADQCVIAWWNLIFFRVFDTILMNSYFQLYLICFTILNFVDFAILWFYNNTTINEIKIYDFFLTNLLYCNRPNYKGKHLELLRKMLQIYVFEAIYAF